MKKLSIKTICIFFVFMIVLSSVALTVFAASSAATSAATDGTAAVSAESAQPEAVSPFRAKLTEFKDNFYLNFIKQGRYKYLVDGLGITLLITVFAVLVGTVIGFVMASVRYSYDQLEPNKRRSFGGRVLGFFNFFAKVYLTVIRGTPVMIQLLIIYYFIFQSVVVSKIFIAIIAFGINSGAYVAEIVRSGLSSTDRGQFEAGRSLGLNYLSTMIKIIIPQAFKNILPALGNELIVLLKETSISGYIALNDLTYGGDTIRSQTYNTIPLFAVALIYLSVVMILSFFVTRLENRLKQSDNRGAVSRKKRKDLKTEVRE